jgi:hypothetical protein
MNPLLPTLSRCLGRVVALLFLLTISAPLAVSRADDSVTLKEERASDRYGMSLEVADVYDPQRNIGFGLVTAFGLFDYGKVWHQDRPKELCFKVEGALGSTFSPNVRAMASLGMLALYNFDRIATPRIRPYFEAGIGAIYTDFRVKGQGLRFNFNPQLGFGAEFPQKDGPASFMALRLHHISNANIVHDNRGVNAVMLQVGRFF